MAVDEILRKIEREYREMPGLKLTIAQAQRLWHLDRTACERALGCLVEQKFLCRTPAGMYVRLEPGIDRMIKSHLPRPSTARSA